MMWSTKLAQISTVLTKKPLQTLPGLQSRVFFASKPPAGSPEGESGRDVRDVGTGKVNVPLGQPTKKADSAEAKYGGKGPGAVSEQHVKDSMAKGKPAAGIPNQPKRSFGKSAFLLAEKAKSSDQSKAAGKGSSSERGNSDFVSDSARQNLNPETHSSRQTGGFQNLDFFPEKPGDPFKSKQGDDVSRGGASNSTYNSKSHNPSEAGRKADDKYLDEALAGKSGPLVENGGNGQHGGSSSSGKGSSGKRNFSTSSAAFTVTPSGKDSSGSGQPAGQGPKSKDSQPFPTPKKSSTENPKAPKPDSKNADPLLKTTGGLQMSAGAFVLSARGLATSAVAAGVSSPRDGIPKISTSAKPAAVKPSSTDLKFPKNKTDAHGRPESIGGADQGGIFEDTRHTGTVGGEEGVDYSAKADVEQRKAPSIHKIVDKVKEAVEKVKQ